MLKRLTKQKTTITLVLLGAPLLLLCVATAADFPGRGGRLDYSGTDYWGPGDIVDRGLSMSPVPLYYDTNTRHNVGVGSYLVNAQYKCYSCHTPQSEGSDGSHYNLREFMGGRCFESYCSINLRPDHSGKPGGMDFDTFAERVRCGAYFPPGWDCSSGICGYGQFQCIGYDSDMSDGIASNGQYSGGGDLLQWMGEAWVVVGACDRCGSRLYPVQFIESFSSSSSSSDRPSCHSDDCSCASNGVYAGDLGYGIWLGHAYNVRGCRSSSGEPPVYMPSFSDLSDSELISMYAYFRALRDVRDIRSR